MIRSRIRAVKRHPEGNGSDTDWGVDTDQPDRAGAKLLLADRLGDNAAPAEIEAAGWLKLLGRIAEREAL